MPQPHLCSCLILLVIFFFKFIFIFRLVGPFVKDYFIYKYKYISIKKNPEAWSRGWNH